jgi:O-antigen/teichoic acid export membrane protein
VLRRVIASALRLNLLMALALTLPVALFGKALLRFWIGAAFASATGPTLVLLAVGFGLLTMNVTAHYTMLALGQIRYLTYVNLAVGVATILLVSVLTRHWGMSGAAAARLLYGPFTWVMYLKIHSLLPEKGSSPAQLVPELIMAGEKEG